jgi:beta-mannan synthase
LGLRQAQQISLNFHCKCEQYLHFASGGFFNFNGTAGAINPSKSFCK